MRTENQTVVNNVCCHFNLVEERKLSIVYNSIFDHVNMCVIDENDNSVSELAKTYPNLKFKSEKIIFAYGYEFCSSPSNINWKVCKMHSV